MVQDSNSELKVVDASCCKKGGGAQVAANLIIHLLECENIENFRFLISSEVYLHLKSNSNKELDPSKFRICTNPTGVISYISYHYTIKKFIPNYKKMKIFCVFGPNYYFYKHVKFMGIADPYLTPWPKSLKRLLTFREKLRLAVQVQTKKYFLFYNKKKKSFWCETNLYKIKVSEKYNIPESNIIVAPNEASKSFRNNVFEPNKFSKEIEILIVGANYPHKNFKILGKVIQYINKSKSLIDYSINWNITLEKTNNSDLSKYFQKNGVDKQINWLGSLTQGELSSVMSKSIILHPSLLEVYSATYIESILMNRPLIVADLDFARSICKNAALYFDPLNQLESIENSLIKLLQDSETEIELSEERQRIFKGQKEEAKRDSILTSYFLKC